MKKLRIIATSVIVLAIVGSAFAFKVKLGRFCILTTTASGNVCTGTIADRKTSTNTNHPQFKYYPCWDGNTVACTTTAGGGLCTDLIRLTIND
jgi:hypothetical protein